MTESGMSRMLQTIGTLPLLAAIASELMLTGAWWLLSRDGEAPAIGMALWIWPLVWLVCVVCGLTLRPSPADMVEPQLQGRRLASHLLRDLAGRAMIIGVPVIVSLYALATIVIAWRASR
jgi:hypothetical protein